MAFSDRRTPSRPIDLVFGPELGLPSDNQVLTLIGHRGAGAASGASGVADYSYQTISNAGDVTAASTEAGTKFGQGSELQAMIVAAVSANSANTIIPSLRAIPLPQAVSDFGPADEALVTAKANRAEFLVSPYDAALTALRNKLRDAAEVMSGAEKVENYQFGTFGCAFNRSTVDPSTLPAPDSRFLLLFYLRDTGAGAEAPVMSVPQMAAACAARVAGNGIPFQNLNNVVVTGVPAPAKQTDWITVGAAAESETVLQKGWTPLRVLPNGNVAFVRTISARLFQSNGVTPVSAYYDVQDLQVLYFWKRTVFTRLSQPDLVNIKASGENAVLIKSEVLRLAQSFEDQDMFQAVGKLASQFRVTRASTDRSRFDVYTPVNVIPGLHVVTTTVEATTQFDTLTV